MIGFDVSMEGSRDMRKFISAFPQHASTIANAVADAFAKRAQASARGQHLPSEAAPSIGAFRSSKRDKPYVVRPGLGIKGRLNFLEVYEQAGSSWPYRPFMAPALASFDPLPVAAKVYDKILRRAF